MDHEFPENDREKSETIICANPHVRGIHDMRTRSDSDRIFVEIHVEMDGDMNLRDAQDVTDSIARAICSVYPNADVLVHQDPAGLVEDRLDELIIRAEKNQAESEW